MQNYRFDSKYNEQNGQLIHVQNENNLKDWLSMGTVPLTTTISGNLWDTLLVAITGGVHKRDLHT